MELFPSGKDYLQAAAFQVTQRPYLLLPQFPIITQCMHIIIQIQNAEEASLLTHTHTRGNNHYYENTQLKQIKCFKEYILEQNTSSSTWSKQEAGNEIAKKANTSDVCQVLFGRYNKHFVTCDQGSN